MFSGLLPLSPKRTQVRLKSPPLTCLALPDPFRTHGRPSVQEYRLRLKRPTPNASRRCPPFKILDRCALLLLRPLSVGRFASLRFRPKKYGTPYFSARNRTSKYSRSCSQSLAELLRLRKAGPLRFIRVIRRGASAAVGREGFDCRRVAAAFWFS